jgi:hypothetical protein
MIKFLKPCKLLYDYRKLFCECCGAEPYWDSCDFDANEEVDEDRVEIPSYFVIGEDYEIIED